MNDVTDQRKRWNLHERIDLRCAWIRHDSHVGTVDRAPPAIEAAVKVEAIFEEAPSTDGEER